MPYPYLPHRRRLPHSISLGGFRTPAAELAVPSLMRPASETLHNNRLIDCNTTTTSSLYKRQIGLLLKPELVDPPPDGMFPAALKEGTMAEAKLAPNLPDWMVEHANRYLASGG